MRDFPASHGGLDYQIKIYIYIYKKMVKPVKPQKSQGFLEESLEGSFHSTTTSTQRPRTAKGCLFDICDTGMSQKELAQEISFGINYFTE